MLKYYLYDKEIVIDPDSRFWWIEGMIISYHLTIEDLLLLKHDKTTAVKRLVAKEFGQDSVIHLIIRKTNKA
jgi:hypothetical protein